MTTEQENIIRGFKHFMEMYPLFEIGSDGEIYLKDRCICDKPLVVDEIYGSVNRYVKIFCPGGRIYGSDYIELRLWEIKQQGRMRLPYHHDGLHLRIPDKVCMKYFDLNIDFYYNSIDGTVVHYDKEAITRRFTIANIIE